MSKEILINIESQEKRVAVVSDGTLDEFYIERPQDKTIVGNIYKGKIEAILPSIGAAFVDIGLPKKGFLYMSEIETAFESVDISKKKAPARKVGKGEEVLVQVVKESFGTKGPRLSAHIGLPGRYLVLMPQEAQRGISRRIEDEEERKRLKAILRELKMPANIGLIVRTAAVGKSRQELQRDALFLMKLWSRIEKTLRKRKAPSMIYEEYDLTLRVVRDSFTDDVTKLYVDSKAEYYRIVRFMRTFLSYLSSRVEFYRGANLFEEKDIERRISKIFDSKVFMKSKAYIVIEQTEGLVVIDVNSGGFRKKVGQEEAAFKVNCEAAAEIVHQLELRDLGGIIVIDFIDMERQSHRREVLNILKKHLSCDRAKYDILGISKFGVVEMTRERIHNTVQSLSFQTCPYCNGKGRVRSALTMAIVVLKELRRFLLNNRSTRAVSLAVNPSVADEISKDKGGLRNIERQFRVRVNLAPSADTHIEEFKIT